MLFYPSRKLSWPDWDVIEGDYVARVLTVTELCALHGISRRQLYDRALSENWPMRRKSEKPGADKPLPPPPGHDMPRRLLRALEMKMTELENRMAGDDQPTSPADCERNARTLNTLVRLYEKLKGISGAQVKGGGGGAALTVSPATKRKEEDRLRNELALRLESLQASARPPRKAAAGRAPETNQC